MKPYEWMSEAEVQEAVADYLRLQYPDVLFHSDYGSGIKLTPSQAKRQKRQNGGRRAWPDMFIAHTLKGRSRFDTEHNMDVIEFVPCGGLFLELKKHGTRMKKKNGDWATEHIAEQAKVLEKLRQGGYCAEFAVGFEEAKRLIDKYLGGK